MRFLNPARALSSLAALSVAATILTAQAPKAPASSSTAMSSAQPAKPFVKPSDAELKKKLTRLQYDVTQHDRTETPFKNEYFNNHAAGIYVDIVSGEPLFSSLDKYESGTGWPAFTRPLVPENFATATDKTLGVDRTEVRSKLANSHLGHIFEDGPKPTGLRYCINSAAMRFIPLEKLEAEGYGEYAKLFAGKK